MALGKQVDAKSYSVPNSLKAYRIGSNSLTQFTRGVDYSLSPMGGSIEFFDSIQTDDYSVKVTENSISSNDLGNLSYAIRYECSAQFLKLTKNTTSYDPVLGIVPVELSEYCIKVSKDSIPTSWPHDEDVIKPDSLCNPNSIMELMNF